VERVTVALAEPYDVVGGEGALGGVGDVVRGRRKVAVVSQPGVADWHAPPLTAALHAAGAETDVFLIGDGEEAKTLATVDELCSRLAQWGLLRGDAIVALGGGVVGDTAGFAAAIYHRGIAVVQAPTTLLAQVDAAIGGKTAVNLPEGKNLVGAFHQPAGVVIDIAFLRTLAERQRRAALGEAVKMAALGDERLFALLEQDGDAIARGDEAAFASGAIAEVVERTAWAKVEVVTDDEHEQSAEGGRIALNLGHSLGHALEAAGGYGDVLHGEAVAAGLRAVARIGEELGVTPSDRRLRIEALLDRLGLATEPLPYPIDTVMAALAVDKKHAGGGLRWVLPTADGYEVRADVPVALVEKVASAMLVGGGVAIGPPA
jgi:3-dehydroquinate synthase